MLNFKYRKQLLFACVAGLVLFCTLNIHSRAGRFNYHSELFADKAGYYVYLPAALLYDFDVAKFPDSIEHKTGQGFAFDHANNKIITKYPYGVALMELPFFLGAHIYELTIGGHSDGFSRAYHYAIDIAAFFYLMLGLFFLFRFLRYYFEEKVVLISLLFLLFGTNLFYYTVQESGLSHVYSFFLFSLFACQWKRITNGENDIKRFIYLGILLGLIIAVRPINCVFVPFFFLIDVKSFSNIFQLLKTGNWKWILVIGCAVVIFIPQLMYYSYLYETAFAYSYGNESFIYKFRPQIHRVLITFENGLLIYNPIHLFTLVGMYLMIKNKIKNAWIPLTLFIAITWLYASWHSPILGCGFGNRGFVEFYIVLSIPLAYVVQRVLEFNSSTRKNILMGIMILCTLYNIKMGYTYDGCWYGDGDWDYKEYLKLLTKF